VISILKLVPALHEDPNLLYSKANVYLAKGCLDIAESLYHKVLNLSKSGAEITPELEVDILHNLGMLSERRHNPEAAIDFYQQALRSGKQHSMTWLFLARVYLERYEKLGDKRDHQAGFKALIKAAEFKPEYPVVKILKERFAH